MAGETNRLLALAKELQPQPDPRELDVIASTGEQVTRSACSRSRCRPSSASRRELHRLAGADRSPTARTPRRASSRSTTSIRADLAAGKVVVVAGFQGVDDDGNITTLGRGGSDTSASRSPRR
jgi:aspartate kinase